MRHLNGPAHAPVTAVHRATIAPTSMYWTSCVSTGLVLAWAAAATTERRGAT